MTVRGTATRRSDIQADNGIGNLYLANFYASHNPGLAAKFIKMNGYERIEVCEHHLGDPGYQVWLMRGDAGTNDWFPRLRDARKAASRMSEVFKLPISAT